MLRIRSLIAPLALLTLTVAGSALADDSVGILVLKMPAVDGASQPHVDKMMGIAAKQAGWSGAKASVQTTSLGADTFVQSSKPHFGFLSLASFLAMRDKQKLEVIGQVTPARAGGQVYHLVSKTASDAAGCKGKKLASDHTEDATFIDNVVFKGKFKLADVTLVKTTLASQTIKKITGGEVDCALIDDAQLEAIAKTDDAKTIKSIWKSDKLPPIVIVAFPAATESEKKGFQSAFPKLCESDGKDACRELGISSVKPASKTDFQSLVTAYGK